MNRMRAIGSRKICDMSDEVPASNAERLNGVLVGIVDLFWVN
jgi:hypothetical protein